MFKYVVFIQVETLNHIHIRTDVFDSYFDSLELAINELEIQGFSKLTCNLYSNVGEKIKQTAFIKKLKHKGEL